MSLETNKIESVDSNQETIENPMDVTKNKDLRAIWLLIDEMHKRWKFSISKTDTTKTIETAMLSHVITPISLVKLGNNKTSFLTGLLSRYIPIR